MSEDKLKDALQKYAQAVIATYAADRADDDNALAHLGADEIYAKSAIESLFADSRAEIERLMRVNRAIGKLAVRVKSRLLERIAEMEKQSLTAEESGRAYAVLSRYVGEPEDDEWWKMLKKLRPISRPGSTTQQKGA